MFTQAQEWPSLGFNVVCQTRSFITAKKSTPKGGGKKGKNAEPDREHDNERLISQNRKARFEYEVLDTLECGIVLVGSEVKSLRGGTCRSTKLTGASRTTKSG